jgi:signal transduction histidine kinase
MKFYPSVAQTLRYLEYSFIAIHILITVSDRNLNDELRWLWEIFFYSIFVILSYVFPVNRPRWQKQIYIGAALLVAVALNFMGVATDLLVYLYIAKSCFLLDRKYVWITVVILGTTWVLSEIWSESVESQQALHFLPPYGFGFYDLKTIAIYSLAIYCAGSIFTTLLSFLVIAEQKSRQKAEKLAKQVETLAASLERTRIARDIHDSLGHTLTNLNLQLEIAQKLRDRDANKAFCAIDLAKMLSSQCIEDVSQALQTIRDSESNFTINLDRALKTLIEQIQQQQSLQVYWEIDLPILSWQTSQQVYYIFKEGLINIQKHACASCVCLKGRSTPEKIILELNDNGIGFDRQNSRDGFGLKGIAERVQILDGEFKLDSKPGNGTRLQIILPLK